MTAEYYYNQWLIRQIIKPLGAYPIRKWAWTLDELLWPTMTLLKNKDTVMIFPEGKDLRSWSVVTENPLANEKVKYHSSGKTQLGIPRMF